MRKQTNKPLGKANLNKIMAWAKKHEFDDDFAWAYLMACACSGSIDPRKMVPQEMINYFSGSAKARRFEHVRRDLYEIQNNALKIRDQLGRLILEDMKH